MAHRGAHRLDAMSGAKTMSEVPAEWVIKRNCSASPKQLALVFASVVAISFTFGVGFAAYGLWMVLPFVGVELLAVALAFLFYGRKAADFERIRIRDGFVRIERCELGRNWAWQQAADRVRVEVQDNGQGLGRRVAVFLVARGERIEVGRHLLGDARLRLAAQIRQSLAAAWAS